MRAVPRTRSAGAPPARVARASPEMLNAEAGGTTTEVPTDVRLVTGATAHIATSGVLGAMVGVIVALVLFDGIGPLLSSGAIGALAGFVAGVVNAVAARAVSD